MKKDKLYLRDVDYFGHAHNIDMEYHLKLLVGDTIVIDHNVMTYNPYFGCRAISFEYDKKTDQLKFTYREKHFICSVKLQATTKSNTEYIHSPEPLGEIMATKKYW